MTYHLDTTQSFTISLTALLEGVGTLFSLFVGNQTTGESYNYDIATGTWSPSVPEAIEGDGIAVEIEVQNTGDVEDTIFAEFVSAEVTPVEEVMQSYLVPVGQTLGTYWSFTMPANNVSITIDAGHEE